MTERPLILVTNDDGIDSPGLLATVEAVLPLGEVIVAAPHEQQTGAGRSFKPLTDRQIYPHDMTVAGQEIAAYSIASTPAYVTLIALLDLVPRRPDLVVSGINYGANIGNGVTISGTVGAALEAAADRVPALAVSLDTPVIYHHSHSTEVDFSVAGHFTRYFAERVLAGPALPFDVDILKIDVPAEATIETDWRLTRVSRERFLYNDPTPSEHRGKLVHTTYGPRIDAATLEPDSDILAVMVDHVVSVSPMSLDLTSRTDLQSLANRL